MEQDNYHATLIRQLKRSQLGDNALPQNAESWKHFLSSVNRSYSEFDQDRYTLERSQEIVSREMQELVDSLNQSQKLLLQAARKAGMADVATSVLHNIGNVLNSVNVLVTVLTETLEKSALTNLEKTIQIMNNNKLALGSFFTDHPQGKHLLEFLNILSQVWTKDQKYMLSELSALKEHVSHIKNIISAQQSISGSKGMVEAVKLSTLLEDSLMMAMATEVNNHEIEIIRRYDCHESFLVDKNKLSQILINVIRNARDAVNEHPVDGKKIFIDSFCKDKYVYIKIRDSGIGVEESKQTKIFSHGFTTKKEGHGFGLHTSALASKEMGGDLQVESEGIGKGATFILKLPLLEGQCVAS